MGNSNTKQTIENKAAWRLPAGRQGDLFVE
jgi:hypothetical protein